MLHEFKHIVSQATAAHQKGSRCVLVSVVDLEGSSYRRPGVRMLISENGEMTGAISGGCVEQEMLRSSQSVFQSGQPKVVTYDGRYRLGCQGVLYILLEPFEVREAWLALLHDCLAKRMAFHMLSYYEKQDGSSGLYGSLLMSGNKKEPFSSSFRANALSRLLVFDQLLKPCFRLLIIGAGHDAVALCRTAAGLGWEVDIVCPAKSPKALTDFPGATSVIPATPETFNYTAAGGEAAMVCMTHNYATDLHYLLTLRTTTFAYIGVVGSRQRGAQLKDDLMGQVNDISIDFLELIHCPAGVDIGAITPEEIAVSIVSEVLAVTRLGRKTA